MNGYPSLLVVGSAVQCILDVGLFDLPRRLAAAEVHVGHSWWVSVLIATILEGDYSPLLSVTSAATYDRASGAGVVRRLATAITLFGYP